jgi:alpha-D-ribose 1-methylphosphonate 5-triphosphate synthase subunit PhnH
MMGLNSISSAMLPGFPNPVLDSQRSFRLILEAIAHPGKILSIPGDFGVPTPLHPASAAVCLTLLDFETPLWTDLSEGSGALSWLRFHCGCPLEKLSARATFALIADPVHAPDLRSYSIGQEESPENSTTVIIQVEDVRAEGSKCLSGPGIRTNSLLEVKGLPEGFWSSWRENHLLYPLGVDVFLTAGTKIVGLPRTTRVEG